MSPSPGSNALGSLLMRRGLITQAQLDMALARQRTTKQFLGEILIAQGWLQPQALLETLSEQSGIPHVSLSLSQIDWRLAKLFPPSFFSEGKCFPVWGDDTAVTVALVNPFDTWRLRSLEDVLRYRRLKPVLVLDQDLKIVYRAYQQQLLKELGARLNP